MPGPSSRQYSFTDFQVSHPGSPPPGDRLDAEISRVGLALDAAVTWTAVSLNSDGSLRSGSVGKTQLQPGLFDDVGSQAVSEARAAADAARAAAQTAGGAAASAQAAAAEAVRQSGSIQVGLQDSATDDQDAANSAAEAAQSAANAAASATAASNSANHADGEAALCSDYGVVTQAWAEHMPDTIPPNILAVMGVTGDHWSSRWWANHASQVISGWEDDINNVGQDWLDQINDAGSSYLEEFYTLYLGAFYYPPTTDALGNPIAMGALHYSLTFNAPYVWNGTAW